MTVLNFNCGGQVFQVHLPGHHAAHEWRNGVPPSDAITFHPRMFGMMRGVVVSGSVLIKISPFYYLKDGAFHVFPETTLNTTPYLATTANKVRLAVVGFNIDTEAIEVYTGSEVVFSALTPPPLPTGMPSGFFPSFLVRLRYNTTELFETDLTDARFALMETGGGGGAPTGAAGGVLAGTYPNPSFAMDMATQAELDAHVNDTVDAHDASAISSVPAGSLAATTVQAALDELDTEKSATSHTHTLGWPGAGKAMINDVEYATIPDAVTAAATGDIIKVGQGTFTLADTLTLNKNITLKGLSAQDTIITQSVGIRTILASGAGAVIEDLTVINTRTTGTVYGITASANCRIARVITSSTGAATDGNGINVSGATVDLIDVEATASGATNNYGLYVQNSGVVNVYGGRFGAATADIYVDTATIDLFDPVLTNSIITAVSATVQGWYFDASGHHTAYDLSRLLWTPPSFSVHKNGTDQTGIVSGIFTKVTWSTESWDTHSWFTSDKFTPQIAGKYFFDVKVYYNTAIDQSLVYAFVYKNGANVSELPTQTSGTGAIQIRGIVILEANGSTDYFELYTLQNSGANKTINGNPAVTRWTAFYLGR